jgi:hypothetical protein
MLLVLQAMVLFTSLFEDFIDVLATDLYVKGLSFSAHHYICIINYYNYIIDEFMTK